jgi:hypothetical protein
MLGVASALQRRRSAGLIGFVARKVEAPNNRLNLTADPVTRLANGARWGAGVGRRLAVR